MVRTYWLVSVFNEASDNLDLQLDLVGFPPLPAGTYAGVLNLRAVTQ